MTKFHVALIVVFALALLCFVTYLRYGPSSITDSCPNNAHWDSGLEQCIGDWQP